MTRVDWSVDEVVGDADLKIARGGPWHGRVDKEGTKIEKEQDFIFLNFWRKFETCKIYFACGGDSSEVIQMWLVWQRKSKWYTTTRWRCSWRRRPLQRRSDPEWLCNYAFVVACNIEIYWPSCSQLSYKIFYTSVLFLQHSNELLFCLGSSLFKARNWGEPKFDCWFYLGSLVVDKWFCAFLQFLKNEGRKGIRLVYHFCREISRDVSAIHKVRDWAPKRHV